MQGVRLRGPVGQAIAECKQTLQLDPHFLLAYRWVANVSDQKGMFDASEKTKEPLVAANDRSSAELIVSTYRRGGPKALLEMDLREALDRYRQNHLDAYRELHSYALLAERMKRSNTWRSHTAIAKQHFLSLTSGLILLCFVPICAFPR